MVAEYVESQTTIRWPWKLTRRDGNLLLFDVARDPGEIEDRSEERPAEVAELGRILSGITTRAGANNRPDIDVIEKLRALGYANDENSGPR